MRQQPTFHRLDRSSAGGGRERVEGAPSSMMVPLPPGWLCLQDCNLTGQLNHPVVVPFVLMHPDVGLALIDVAPASSPEAEIILRRRLQAARFDSIFPGHLPILHLRLDRADLPATEAILRDAFAALPPLSVPGGDGWVSVVKRALLPRDPSRAAAHAAGRPHAAEQAQRFPRPAATGGPAAWEAETESDMLHREAATRAAAPLPEAPEPAARSAHPLPWIIMSGVGGLIAALAVFGLLNTGGDAPNTAAVEEAARPPAAAVPPPAPTPTAPAAPTLAAPPAPSPAPGPVASSPKPPPAAAPSAAAPPPPLSSSAAPPAPPPADASAAAGASAAPAPAQRPAATAADRLPRVTVRQPANLRASPDSQANILRVVPRGESFRVHNRTGNGWVQVGDSEPRGWLHTSRLGDIEQ